MMDQGTAHQIMMIICMETRRDLHRHGCLLGRGTNRQGFHHRLTWCQMANLTNPKIIWLKGVLFAALGCLAAGLLIAQMPTFRTAGLLAISIWAFCRTYYFAFYVIERYVDPDFRFTGLIDFARYALFGAQPDKNGRG